MARECLFSTLLYVPLLTVFLYNGAAGAFCYRPDGGQESLEYQPCNQVVGTASMCCATNRTNPSGGNLDDGWTVDNCLPNGLCQNESVLNGQEAVTYWRVGCSVSSWEAPCLEGLCEAEEDDVRHPPYLPVFPHYRSGIQ
jgi:hypothetical protein